PESSPSMTSTLSLHDALPISDYDLAYGSLGILLDSLQDFAGAATQFKKALTLNPGNLNAQYNLGNAYASEGDYIAAIREYREVKDRKSTRLNSSHGSISYAVF